MNRRLQHIWTHPTMEKWGRLAILFAFIVPTYVWFESQDDHVRQDQYLLLFIVTALFIGLVASVLTTVRYPARSLGLLAIILGSFVYYFYIFLRIVYDRNYEQMANFTRSCFLIGSPLFALSTVITIIQDRKERRVSSPRR